MDKLLERINDMLDKLMYYSNPYEADYITGTVGAIFGTLEEFSKCLPDIQENREYVELNGKGIIKEVKLLGIEEEQELIVLVNDIIDYFEINSREGK